MIGLQIFEANLLTKSLKLNFFFLFDGKMTDLMRCLNRLTGYGKMDEIFNRSQPVPV